MSDATSPARTIQDDPALQSLPPRDALAALPRDLRFYEPPSAPPRALAPAQVAAFARDGYLAGLRVLDGEAVARQRAWFDGVLARTLAAGRDSYSLNASHLRFGPIWDLLRHPGIVAIAQDLLGEDVVGWGAHFFCKLPGDGKAVRWHQDASYWPLTPSRTVTAWLAIDDARVDNACMRYIPGSHRHGHLTWRMVEGADAVLDQEVPGAERFGAPVDVELDAGCIAVHSDLLLHGSESNRSPRRRCGLTLRYCAASVRAGLGWNAKGVVVAGRDPSGHWADAPRPAAEA